MNRGGRRAAGALLLLLSLAAAALVARRSEWARLAYEPGAIAESDFQLHWAAGQVMAAGGDPYDSAAVQAIGAPTGRTFTPFCAANPLVVRLFGLADRHDLPGAYRAWRDVNVALLALAVVALGLAVRRVAAVPAGAALALAAAALLLDDGTWMAFYYNQTNVVTLVAVVGALLAGQAGRPMTEGALLALATAAKTSPALLLVVVALAGRRRTALAGLLTLAALGGLSLAWNGAGVHLAYLDTLRSRLGYAAAVAPGEFNNSLHDWNLAPNGLLSRAADAAGWPPAAARGAAWAATLVVLVLLARAVRRLRRSAHAWDAADEAGPAVAGPPALMGLYALGVSAGFLASSVTWSPHLSLAALPIAWLVLAGPRDAPPARRLLDALPLAAACAVLFVPLGTFAEDVHQVLDVRLKTAACVVLYALVLTAAGRPAVRARYQPPTAAPSTGLTKASLGRVSSRR